MNPPREAFKGDHEVHQREVREANRAAQALDLDPWLGYLMNQVEDLQERAYGRDGVARRREERESPFTEEISLAEIPHDMKIPRKDMCGYNETGDPNDYLDAYLHWMNIQGASDALKCKIFPLTLVEDVRTWISGLRRRSISNFAELQREFRIGFAGSGRRMRYIVHLASVKQQPNESLRDYIKRFQDAARQVQNFSDMGALMASTEGLRDERLSWSLSKNRPSSYRELMERVEKYVTAEEISGIKGKS
ncbi:hypothetical protein ACOSQ3_026586 [Xanthoceras sorbifolium]